MDCRYPDHMDVQLFTIHGFQQSMPEPNGFWAINSNNARY